MSCNKCGSSTRCGCGITQCGQSNCGTPSCCQEIIPATPQPFYADAPICAEDHCKTVVRATYAASVKIEDSFQMPACGQSAQLRIVGLVAIAVPSYIWNQAVGYLQVIAFNAYDNIITVQNNCQTGNASPGTSFPACTLFVVTDPPAVASGSSQTGCFVGEPGFTAPPVSPAVGSCILIAVTCVNNLAVNKNVGIGSGYYRVNAIPDSTHIEICNEGGGITPGTAVTAKNGAGEYQYPLTAIDVNPCTNPPVLEGSIVVCDDGLQQPLEAASAGMVPVSTGTDNKFKAQFLEVPTRTCATIPCCFTIVAGLAGPYVVEVSDTSEFLAGDILQIGTRTDRFVVDVVVDGTHLQGHIDPVPAATTEVAVGTSICIIDCCEDLQNQINDTNQDLADLINNLALGCGIGFGPFEITTPDNDVDTVTPGIVQVNGAQPSFVGDPATVVVENTSTCRNMVVDIHFNARIFGVYPVGSNPGVFFYGFEYNVDGSPFTPILIRKAKEVVTPGDYPNDQQVVYAITLLLAPAQVATVIARPRVVFDQGHPTDTVFQLDNPSRAANMLIHAIAHL